MRNPTSKSSRKSDEPAVVDDDLISGIPDTLENCCQGARQDSAEEAS